MQSLSAFYCGTVVFVSTEKMAGLPMVSPASDTKLTQQAGETSDAILIKGKRLSIPNEGRTANDFWQASD